MKKRNGTAWDNLYPITLDTNVFDKDGKEITSASFKIMPNRKYIRIEITDKYGKKAWSNPVYYRE